jgi:malonate transporter
MPHIILLALCPMFFVMALGYAAGWRGIVDNSRVGELNALVMDFALPAALFAATATTPRREMLVQWQLFAVLGIVMVAQYFSWYLFRRRAACISQGAAAIEALTVALPNFAAVGLPIVSAVLGSGKTVPVAVAIAAGAILPSPLTILLLELSGKMAPVATEAASARIRRALRRALTRPIVLAPFLGILLSLSGLPLNDVVTASFLLIGRAAPGVALFLTGLVLSAQSFRLDRTTVYAAGMTNLIQPSLVAAIVFIFPFQAEIAKLAILLAALPSGFFGILFGVRYRQDTAAAGAMIIASTLLSIVTLPIVMAILYPP